MECNKDEAIRAKKIAEEKCADGKDFVGAKKLTQKAQTLYPKLDGISELLITLDVYISSESKVDGESDWYKVLDVNPFDDDKTIRKQYMKLALMLHPDKNKSVGANGAIKIINEAWGLLSDKEKRSAYNERRNLRSSPNVTGDHDYSANKSTSDPENCKSTNTTQTGPTPVAHESDKFWTICYRCKGSYEYLKTVCPSCSMLFLAAQMAAPPRFIPPVVQATYPFAFSSNVQMPQPVYYTQPDAQATGQAPWSGGLYNPNAQMPQPVYYTQPAAQATGWNQWSSGSHIPNAQMEPSMGYTQPVAQNARWAQRNFGSHTSNAQMAPSMGHTQPVAQNAGCAQWSPGSHISNSQMAPLTGHTQPVAQNAEWASSGSCSYEQTAPSMGTQPVLQNTSWEPSSSSSYVPMAPQMGYTQPDRQNPQEEPAHVPSPGPLQEISPTVHNLVNWIKSKLF